MKLILVAGARPNFMKIASIIHAIHSDGRGIEYVLVHTGQHYDKLLSDNFFEDLKIPSPHYNLQVGSGSHAVQTADIMKDFEGVLLREKPNLVLVVGDVNSTMACTLTAKKMNIEVAHVEAGIRSFDNTMPEEINRMVTDSIADYFFTTTEIANENLLNHGAKKSQIYLVGNTMIDTLCSNLSQLVKPNIINPFVNTEYIVLTLHRPSNVDDEVSLFKSLNKIGGSVNGRTIIFPVHPRTQAKLKQFDLPQNIILSEPLRYLEFIYLIKNAWAVVTDSGGIQEETTYLSIPCITLRPNTERPETVFLGTNTLADLTNNSLEHFILEIEKGTYKKGQKIPMWDGKTGPRIVSILKTIFNIKE